MKNLYFKFLIFFLLISNNSYCQGNDVIIWLDNSTSISNEEFADMTTSVQQIISAVLDCNPDNRVAIVHYGGENGDEARIFIEDPNNNGAFTNNQAEAINFTRRTAQVGGQDYAHEALELIGRALDSNPLTLGIVSPRRTLNHGGGRNLVLYLFTDGHRNLGSSWLVNRNASAFNANNAFVNYTNFKNDRNATFVVTTIAPNINAQNAGAVIASVSNTGNYNGTMENYPADPDNGALPRMYLNRTSFLVSPNDLGIITSDLCFIETPCPLTLTLTSAINDVSAPQQDNRQVHETIFASNVINVNAGAIYHAGDFVELNPGFEAVNGSRFSAYIEGCSDTFIYRAANVDDDIKNDSKLSAENIKLYPNPTNNYITVDYTVGFNQVRITSIDGKTVFNQKSDISNSKQIDVSNLKNGIYTLSIVTAEGATLTEKLIKN